MTANQKVNSTEAQPNGVPIQTGLGTRWLYIAGFILFVIGAFIADVNGQRYLLLGGSLWVLALIISFAIVLINSARHLLPIDGDAGWYEGARLLYYYTFFIRNGGMGALFNLKKFKRPPAGIDESFGTLGAGFVASHQVLAITRGRSFSRVGGPGYVRLERGESIRHVIDLRPHIRFIPVQVMTRDGIPLDTTITLRFRVRQLPVEETGPARQYRPVEDAIFRLSYAGSRSSAAGLVETDSWHDRIGPLAAASLITHLSAKTLDELYPTSSNVVPPLDTLQTDVRQDLEKQLKRIFDHGNGDEGPIEILTVSIGQLKPPDDVVEQRIRNWQLSWQRHISDEEAEGDAEVMRRIKLARARAQLDLLENIVENIEAMHRAGHEDLSEIVRLRMIEAMEEALSDNQVQAFLPQRVMSALDQMHAWISDPPRQLGDGTE